MPKLSPKQHQHLENLKNKLNTHPWLKKYYSKDNHNILWSVNKKGISKAIFIGLFSCFMPMPFQMILAAILAIIFGANILLSAALVWISNPITMLPMMYGCYLLGNWVLQTPILFHQNNLTFHFIFTHLHHIFLPLIIGCVISGLVIGGVVSSLVYLFWKK